MANAKWSSGQIKYLELNYMNFTNKELAETLGRSEKAVSTKLSGLGLKRILTPKDKEKMIEDYKKRAGVSQDKKRAGVSQDKKRAGVSQEYKVCCKCKKVLPTEKFSKNKSRKDGYDDYCKKCGRQYEIDRKSKKRQQEAYARYKETLRPMEEARARTEKEIYVCKTCGATLPGKEFYFDNRTLKRRKECKKCAKERNLRNELRRIKEGYYR